MISRIVGTVLKKDTRTKLWWLKLAVALVLSNIFFFALFSSDSRPEVKAPERAGLVEIQLKAELMTPFQSGKKVVLVNRAHRLHLEGVLESSINEEGKLTVWVKETEAEHLFRLAEWEILPFLPNFKFPRKIQKGEGHEIRY